MGPWTRCFSDDDSKQYGSTLGTVSNVSKISRSKIFCVGGARGRARNGIFGMKNAIKCLTQFMFKKISKIPHMKIYGVGQLRGVQLYTNDFRIGEVRVLTLSLTGSLIRVEHHNRIL